MTKKPMAQISNVSYLERVAVPQYSTDPLPRRHSFQDDTARRLSNENLLHGSGGPLNHGSHPSRRNHVSDTHQASAGRQQFQGVFAPALDVTDRPAVGAEDALRSNKSSSSSVDYQLLLLSLAEEYFSAAYAHETLDAIYRGEVEMHAYHKLIATGLGCLEALLKVGNFWNFWSSDRAHSV